MMYSCATNICRQPRFIILFIAFSAIAGCNGKDLGHAPKRDSLVLRIYFHPAFAEWSETILKRSVSEKSIQLLLREQQRADIKQDTFWFKKVYLSDQKCSEFDSTLVSACQQKITRNDTLKGVDGMTINTLLTNGIDTNFIHLWSPQKSSDSIGYRFTESLLTTLRSTFRDTLAGEYFDELEEYVDDSKHHITDPNRKIDQLRMQKYGWRIQKTVSK